MPRSWRPQCAPKRRCDDDARGLAIGSVYVSLFTAFAGKAVELRVNTADVRLVVTDPAQRAKLASDLN